MNYLSRGNKEMGPEVYLFNLPIEKTCRPTPWCKKNCYGKKGNYIRFRKSIGKALLKRYWLSLTDKFIEVITEEIFRRKIDLVRVHATGDFYSKKYVQKWIEIAKNCPQTLFRTTTKRRDLQNVILKLDSLPNFHIRESLDLSRTKPSMGLPIATINTLDIVKDKKRNFFICKQNCKLCNYTCWYNKNKNYCFPII